MRFTILELKKRFLFGNEKPLKNWQYLLEPVFFFSLHLLHDFVVVVQAGGDVQEACVVSYSKIKKRAIYAKNQLPHVCNQSEPTLLRFVQNCDVTPS